MEIRKYPQGTLFPWYINVTPINGKGYKNYFLKMLDLKKSH